PGVPDIYQGNEIWDFSLVDPDNRRPVDYGRRERLLRALETELATPEPGRVRALLERIEDGRAKLYLTWKVLSERRRLSALYRDGEYLPLGVEGAQAERVCAFARRLDDALVVTAVPRWVATFTRAGAAPLGEVWNDTWLELPRPGRYRNLLTGEEWLAEARGQGHGLAVSAAFRSFPVALL